MQSRDTNYLSRLCVSRHGCIQRLPVRRSASGLRTADHILPVPDGKIDRAGEEVCEVGCHKNVHGQNAVAGGRSGR